MAEPTQLDTADRTPVKVLNGMLAAHKLSRDGDCIWCAVASKLGFFFDRFARSRAHDTTDFRHLNRWTTRT